MGDTEDEPPFVCVWTETMNSNYINRQATF